VAMKIIALGAIMAGIGVALGAFGAHGLKARVSPEMLTIYETAVTYQFYHCFALIVLGLVALRVGDQWVMATAVAFFVGILVFSGSLYLMVLTDSRWLGAITPLGGLSFLVGWGLFARLAWEGAKKTSGF
jgi:uncharacterized membrane protein YgdD (TMEM256/DUF423 family)